MVCRSSCLLKILNRNRLQNAMLEDCAKRSLLHTQSTTFEFILSSNVSTIWSAVENHDNVLSLCAPVSLMPRVLFSIRLPFTLGIGIYEVKDEIEIVSKSYLFNPPQPSPISMCCTTI